MPRKLKMRLLRQDPPREETFEPIVTETDWAYLIAFRDEVRRMAACEWVRAGLNADYRIDYTQDNGVTIHVPHKPTNAQVAELLEGLRPFLLRVEDLHFDKIMAVLEKYFTHPWLKPTLKGVWEAYRGEDQAAMFQLSANDLQLNTEPSLNLWLNAFRFHRDKRKAAAFITKAGREPDELMLAVFRSLIAAKALTLIRLGDWVSEFEKNS